MTGIEALLRISEIRLKLMCFMNGMCRCYSGQTKLIACQQSTCRQFERKEIESLLVRSEYSISYSRTQSLARLYTACTNTVLGKCMTLWRRAQTSRLQLMALYSCVARSRHDALYQHSTRQVHDIVEVSPNKLVNCNLWQNDDSKDGHFDLKGSRLALPTVLRAAPLFFTSLTCECAHILHPARPTYSA